VLAIGWLLWHLVTGRDQKVAEPTKPPVEETTSPAGEAPYSGLFNKLKGIKVGDTDTGELAISAVDRLYSTLTGIKDEASAQANLTSLNQASSEFDQLAWTGEPALAGKSQGAYGNIRLDQTKP
jgi:hypothetical protein